MTQVTDIASQVVELIAPLSSEDKKRVMRAALLLAGEDVDVKSEEGTSASDDATGVVPKAIIWMKQNSVTMEELGEVFHIDGGTATLIALPGKTDKEKTLNVYLLAGIANLLTSGVATIDDKDARSICEGMGCYNSNHHSEYVDEKGNLFIGSKKDGWTLTMPGQKAAALLIKELSKSE